MRVAHRDGLVSIRVPEVVERTGSGAQDRVGSYVFEGDAPIRRSLTERDAGEDGEKQRDGAGVGRPEVVEEFQDSSERLEQLQSYEHMFSTFA